MNAIISQYRNKLNLSAINQNIIRLFPVDLKISVESSNGYLYGCNVKAPVSRTTASDSNRSNHYEYYNRYQEFKSSSYYNNRYYIGSREDYIIKKASEGSYKMSINAYHYYSYQGEIPEMVRVIAFKNFQKPNQTMQVEYSMLNNQYGAVEIAEINW